MPNYCVSRMQPMLDPVTQIQVSILRLIFHFNYNDFYMIDKKMYDVFQVKFVRTCMIMIMYDYVRRLQLQLL